MPREWLLRVSPRCTVCGCGCRRICGCVAVTVPVAVLMAKDPISSGSCPSGWQPEECNSCDVLQTKSDCLADISCAYCDTAEHPRCVPAGSQYAQKCPSLEKSCRSNSDCTACMEAPSTNNCVWCAVPNEGGAPSCMDATTASAGQCQASIPAQQSSVFRCEALEGCGSYTSQCQCASDSACGWCAGEDVCLPVTATGLCATTLLPPCFGQSCADCVSGSNSCCGYCVNSADEGAVCESNVLTDTCPSGLIPHSSNANSCTDTDECAALEECGCFQHPSCGWCATTERCIPSSYSDTCDGHFVASCSGLDGCETCTETSCCQYCEGTDSQCQDQQSTCTGFATNDSAMCPDIDMCASLNSKCGCVGNAACGWCERGEEPHCRPFESSQSCTGDGEWMGPCASFDDCTSCVIGQRVLRVLSGRGCRLLAGQQHRHALRQ